jgi:hypothetical protein
MLINEEAALEEFKADGWCAFRNGWPDYLLIRSKSDGKSELMGLEVKCDRDSLKTNQLIIHTALSMYGIKVVVKRVKSKKKLATP